MTSQATSLHQQDSVKVPTTLLMKRTESDISLHAAKFSNIDEGRHDTMAGEEEGVNYFP